MSRGRTILGLVVATMFLFRAGDCMTYLFADQQARDCCKRGECSRSQDADPCCQNSKVTSAQHFQAQERVSVPVLDQVQFAGPAPLNLVDSLGWSMLLSYEDAPDPPPGGLALTSLPLLI
jgi:chitodextrinase